MRSFNSSPPGLPVLDFEQGNHRSLSIDSIALMFQAILQEDRIAPLTRVWLARLQMPLIRLALAKPTMFGNESDPSLSFLTQISSCAIGPQAGLVPADALGVEIQRLVLQIEKNATGGDKAYAQAHMEFNTFLARYRQPDEVVPRVEDLDLQQEKRGVFTVQYSLVLRDMLHGIQVSAEVRDFLFKVWAEVLALSAVQHGQQDARTLALKQAVTALIWATGARRTRRNRARVIKDIPQLLQILRDGMDSLGLTDAEKKGHITTLSAPMMDAFIGKKAHNSSTPSTRSEAHGVSRGGSVVRSKVARTHEFPGMEVTEDYPSTQGMRYWESAQAEQKDPVNPT